MRFAMFDLTSIPAALLRGVILSGLGLAWVILLVRVVGTRTLSKMTAFDFLVTLSSASLLATAGASEHWSGFAQAVAAITTLITAQYALSVVRRRSDKVRHLLENQPLMLVQHGQFLDDAMRSARVARSDVMAKLREADISDISLVAAVVLETTGDVSIITGQPIGADMIKEVRTAAATASPAKS